jgi:hypothetical protein
VGGGEDRLKKKGGFMCCYINVIKLGQ